MDILALDSLLSKARDARNEKLMEEARIMRVAINSGFSGDEAVFKSLLDAYSPAPLRAAQEEEKIARSVKHISKLFSGG